MTATVCPRHPGAAAVYRCDGCGEALCADCVTQGHRLDFCKLCGERALPLAAGPGVAPPAATITDRRRAAIARSAAGYDLGRALAYPFRGAGASVFWSFVALLTLLDLAALFLPFGGALTTAPNLVIALLMPRFLLSIANSTAQGDDELPEWPDLDVWEMVRSLLLFALSTALSLLPLGALLYACQRGGAPFAAWLLAAAAGLVVGVALWVPTFGATALFDTFLAAFRLDLHLRAMAVAPGELAKTTVVLGGLLFIGGLLPSGLEGVPLVGWLAAHTVTAYVLFVGAHLVGVYFRRHWGELERVYLG